MGEIIAGFLFGILASLIAAMILNYFNSNLFARRKYKNIIGKYSHPNGIVELKHLKGEYFQAFGQEKSGVCWVSSLKYLGNSVFTGIYDWNLTSDSENDWGEHHLHILPSGNISVIWINKSVEKELTGRLIWVKKN